MSFCVYYIDINPKILYAKNESLCELKKQAEKVKKNVDKNQKDYLLREQQKVIREELGEDDIVSEADEYLEKCEALKASKEVKDKIKKEIKRYKKMPPVAAESTMTKNYIETMLEMPWNKVSRDSKSLEKAMEILEEDHYGLKKVKERLDDNPDYISYITFLEEKNKKVADDDYSDEEYDDFLGPRKPNDHRYWSIN
mgnify:CR=1 FL=1